MARSNEQRISRALELEAMGARYAQSRPDISAIAFKNARLLRRITARKLHAA